RENLHDWLPSGLTLLGGKSKSGKSTLAEQIAEELSLYKKVLYLALEYNKRTAQIRFDRFTPDHQIHIVLEGELNRMGKGGETELDDLIYAYKPDLVIVDVLAKLKRHNSGSYDAEYESMSELKELMDKYDVDCLVLTHTGKPSNNDGDDQFDKIIGSTALLGVPDNLMLLANSNGQTKLVTKGRLIHQSEKVLSFENGKYFERTGASAEYEDRAPIQALVLKELEIKPSTVSELVEVLGKDKGQISNICKTLSEAGKITRPHRNAAWELTDTAS
ncbi:MAG: AAA family ATPase, partial [Paracoccaceae bacterium]